MAIGRTLFSPLGRAISLAAARAWPIGSSGLPEAILWAILKRHSSKSWTSAQILRCSKRSPDGPGADPLGDELRALRKTFLCRVIEGSVDVSHKLCRLEFEASGCFSFSSSKVCGESGASPLLVRRRDAR